MGAQPRFLNTETRRSFSRLTIGSAYYPKQCSATYCHYSPCTPSGMIRTCATSLRTIHTARCAKPNRPTSSAIICNITLVGRTIWFCPIPGCPSSLSSKEGLVKHLQSRPHGRGIELNLGRKVAKQIANQNCYWPVTQVMADKLLVTSKRLIRYIALYSMAGVAMENRLFRIHPNARDTPFMEACAAFLTPKMSLSQVMPSGCHLRRFAQPPANQLAVTDRPSASDYPEVEESITPEEMRVAVATPVFQPYRGETGRAWMAKEYGVTMDTSSLMSSETERDETDDEVCSFDLGPEPYDPTSQARLPSDEWLDDHQQGLQPGSSEPRPDPYDRYLAMPIQPSILDMMRSEMETSELNAPPPPPERAPSKTIRWDFDYTGMNHPLYNA